VVRLLVEGIFYNRRNESQMEYCSFPVSEALYELDNGNCVCV
jgi:hypothetical protein